MTEKFRVVFNSPQSGFMSVGLSCGEGEFTTAVACGPYDSLRDLAAALARLARGETSAAVVRWNCEPDELDFRFAADGERLSLAVVYYPTHRREERASETVFAASGARAEVCAAFQEVFARLQEDAETDEFASNWRREFPEREANDLAAAVAALGRKEEAGGGGPV
jgi:hypothetical protein